METKLCPKCNEIKPRSQFGYSASRSGNISSYCKPCMNKTCIAGRKNKKEYYNKYKRERYRRTRDDLIIYMGGKCVYCDYSDIRALDIDHVKNDGAQNRKQRGKMDAVTYLKEIKKYPDRFQVLCRNCNWIKYLDYSGTTNE